MPATAGAIRPGRRSAGGPALAFGYLGGSAADEVVAMAKDPDGNLVVTGDTASTDMAASAGAAADERGDVYVKKMKADGSAVLWTARLGGTKLEAPSAVAVDAKGDVYVTGWTTSSDFPTSATAFQRFGQGNDDGFVAKLSGKDGSLIYATLAGGTGNDDPTAISVDEAGVVSITGHTSSKDYPTKAGSSRAAFSSGPGAMITRLDAKGAALVSSTVLSGDGWVNGYGVASLADGTTLVAGETSAGDLVMVKSWQKNHQSAGIFRSGNAAVTWINSANGARGVRGESMVIDPTNPQILYVATMRGVFKSTDGGITWAGSNTGMTAATAQYIAIDPKTPTNLYAATSSGGLFRSTDGGASWAPANSGLGTSVWQVTVDPVTPTTLYATTNTNGIMKSTDSGDTWNPSNGGIDYPYIIQVAVDPQTPSTLYAAGYFGIYRSRDSGVTWTMLNAGTVEDIYVSVAVDPNNPSNLYASTIYNGSIRSTDGGASWRAMRGSGMFNYVTAYEFKTVAKTPGVVYAATDLGVYKSLNSGETWSNPAEELQEQLVLGLAPNPLDDKVVYACGELTGDLFFYHLDKDGQTIVSSTYMGGADADSLLGLTTDEAGNVYFAGGTHSDDFPTTPGAPQEVAAGGSDAFVARMPVTLDALPFSTLFGGSGGDTAGALALEGNGVVAVAGATSSGDLPVTADLADAPLGGASDAFVARISTLAPGFQLSTQIGGAGVELAGAVAVTAAGPVIGGATNSRDLTGTMAGLSPTYLGGATDGFLATVTGLVAEATLEQTSLTFDILLDGSPLVAERTIAVTSPAGALPLEAVVPADVAWLQAAANPEKAGELIVKVDATGLEPGEYTATIEVSSPAAGVAAVPVKITLRVKNPTPPTVTGVLHGVERTAQAIAPGLPIVVQGDGFLFTGEPVAADDTADSLPAELAGVTVAINGTPAVLQSVSATEIAAIVPFALTGDTASIVVSRGGLDSAPFAVAAAPTAPGLMTADGSGQGQLVAENEDWTTNTADNPAVHGRPVILHGVGGGVMTPALVDGQLVADADHAPEAKVEVLIGGLPCDVYYWGNAPGKRAGVLELNLKVPDDVTPGPAVPVVLRIGGKDSTQTVSIAVR